MHVPPRILAAVRPFARKGIRHWVAFAVMLAMGWYLGHLLDSSPWLTNLRYSFYQSQLMLRDRSPLYPQRTSLILLDDDDYWGNRFQARSSLRRDRLAELIDRLNAAGVNTIAIDVDLRSPLPNDADFDFSDYQAEDAEFFAAIGRLCAANRHVVLASSVTFASDGYHEAPSIYSNELSHLPCVRRGYIQLPFDMRRIPGTLELADGGHLDSLSLAVTGIADPIAHDHASTVTGKGFRFSQYLTVADFGPHDGQEFIFSGRDLLKMKIEDLHNHLADRLVFLGANWHSNAYGMGPMVDIHASPGGAEPGLMLHANYVEAMLDRTGTFAPLADTTGEAIEVLMVFALALVGTLEIHAAWKWAAFVTACIASAILTYILLQNLGIFLDFLVPFIMVVIHTLFAEFTEMVGADHHNRPIPVEAHQ